LTGPPGSTAASRRIRLMLMGEEYRNFSGEADKSGFWQDNRHPQA